MTIVDSTLIEFAARGVAATKGHVAGNGGLRGHSVGDIFPFIVFAKGNPHKPNGLHWYIRKPDGSEVGGYVQCSTAHTVAAALKSNEVSHEQS